MCTIAENAEKRAWSIAFKDAKGIKDGRAGARAIYASFPRSMCAARSIAKIQENRASSANREIPPNDREDCRLAACPIRTDRDGDLGRWLQSLLTTHACGYYRYYRTTGHVWQGRFKAFPVEDDDHLVTVLRDVERNALRAELVSRAQELEVVMRARMAAARFAAVYRSGAGPRQALAGEDQRASLSPGDLQRLRRSVARGRPYGSE